MDINNKLIEWIPNLIGKPYKIISTHVGEPEFNCVSFSLDIFDDWTWTNEACWDTSIPRNLKVQSFRLLYNKHGYEECNNSDYEHGYDKIAFYAIGLTPTHAAKQFKNMWRSKINIAVVEHELDWINGNDKNGYGEVVFIMKRKIILNENILKYNEY